MVWMGACHSINCRRSIESSRYTAIQQVLGSCGYTTTVQGQPIRWFSSLEETGSQQQQNSYNSKHKGCVHMISLAY